MDWAGGSCDSKTTTAIDCIVLALGDVGRGPL